MPTSRHVGRVERQQAYAAKRAVDALAKKLKKKTLSNAEARGLTAVAAKAARASAAVARAVTSSGAGSRRSGRRRKIRSSTYDFVREVTGGGRKRSGGKRRKGASARRGKSIAYRSTRRKLNRSRFKALSKKTRGWSKKARSRYATGADYINMKAYRSANFGPVPFAHQPTWVRKLGRKQGRGRKRSR